MERLDPKLMDDLLSDCKTPADVKNLYSQLLQRMINRSLEAELDAHLKYDKGERSDAGQRRINTRNGKGNKTIKGEFGELQVETPRDRDGSFEPKLVQKRQIRLAGMEEHVRQRHDHPRH